jgi:hypothetical protein
MSQQFFVGPDKTGLVVSLSKPRITFYFVPTGYL